MALRFAREPRAEAILRELIVDAEDRLTALERTAIVTGEGVEARGL